MKLKTACTIALIMTLAAILLTIVGNAAFYAALFTEHFHITMLTHAAVPVLIFLLDSGGFIMLLLAVITRLRNPDTNTKTLFMLAAVLVILGALISMASSIMYSFNFNIYKHLPVSQFLLYMSMYLVGFLSSLCLGIFALSQTSVNQSGKSLASATLALCIVLLVTMIISHAMYFQNYFHTGRLMQTAGSMAMSLGYFIARIAVIFFLLIFLKHRPWPPTAGVADISPDPLPTLSAHADLPE